MSGVDFIGIDIEHSTISDEQSQRIIAAAHANGVVCLPRIATHNAEAIKRLADSGADGIIVPMVCTPAEIARLVEWMKYPPVGRRSYGVARAQRYGFDFGDYTATWNESSSLVVQIESVEGVERVDDLLTGSEVDAVMIGPYDLSGSLGIPGQLDHPRVMEAMQYVISACASRGRGCATQLVSPDARSVREAVALGYTCIVLASDVFILWKWSEAMRAVVSSHRDQ